MLIITAIISIGSLYWVGRNFTNFYDEPYQVSTKVMDMRRAIQASVKYIAYAFNTPDKVKTE